VRFALGAFVIVFLQCGVSKGEKESCLPSSSPHTHTPSPPHPLFTGAAVKNIAMLTAQFGMEWAQSYVVDQLLELVDAGHIHRMTFCLAVQELAPIFVRHDGITIYLERFLPALRTLATNEVPNVRFSVAKAMQATAVEAAGSAGAAEIEAIIRPVLRRFLEDDDVDVTFFANSGLLALSKK
jgi:serine/threonine-protein phosphatase 2A regulatory subunit A